MIYKCKHYEAYYYDADTVSIVAYSPETQTALQRWFKTYPKGTKFQPGDEPLFRVNRVEFFRVLEAFGRRGIPTPSLADLDARNPRFVDVSSNIEGFDGGQK